MFQKIVDVIHISSGHYDQLLKDELINWQIFVPI